MDELELQPYRFNKAPNDRCPHCGSSDGYYTKEQVRGPVQYTYNFDGTESDNGEMYETFRTREVNMPIACTVTNACSAWTN